MGYYIETKSPRQKALQLVERVNAKIELGPFFDPTFTKVPICVVSNGPFDAAAIGFSQQEVDKFSHDDGRPRIWLSLPKETVIALCPQAAKHLQ